MNTTQHPAVVIVGAGPVGLIAACELARRGVDIRIIDKLAAPTTRPTLSFCILDPFVPVRVKRRCRNEAPHRGR